MSVLFSFSVSAPVVPSPSTGSAAIDAGALALRDKKLDTVTGDLLFGDDMDQEYTQDIEAIASDLKSNWLFFKGEWFLNIGKGIDYWGVVFAKGATNQGIEAEFRREALATPGVTAIVLTLTRGAGRQLTVKGVVTVDTGKIFTAVLGANAGT